MFNLSAYKEDSLRLSKVFDLSVTELEGVLSRQKAITEVTRTATLALSAYAKVRATEVHEMALYVMLSKKDTSRKGLNK